MVLKKRQKNSRKTTTIGNICIVGVKVEIAVAVEEQV